jgi:hypothetical protein
MAMKTKAVAASLVQPGRVSVYGIGTDDGMYYKIWDGDRSQPSRTGWLPLGGKFDSVPSVFAKNFQLAPWDGQAFGLGSNNEMFFRTVGNFTFPPPPQAWQPLGGIFNSPPTALSCGPEGAVKWAIVGLGTDNQSYLKLFDERANAWLPSIDGWFPLGGKLIYEMDFAVIGGATAQTIALFGVGTGRHGDLDGVPAAANIRTGDRFSDVPQIMERLAMDAAGDGLGTAGWRLQDTATHATASAA